MPRYRSTRLLVLAIIAATFAGCSKPETTGEALVLMDNYRTQLQYERALQIGKEWLARYPDDGAMYAEMGVVYLEKARATTTERERLVAHALQMAHKAVELAPRDYFALDMAASVFEGAAALSTKDRCVHYRNAVRVLDHWAFWEEEDNIRNRPGDPGIADSRKFHSALLKRRQAVQEKAANAACREVEGLHR
jgi:hypothetical protein